MNMVTFKKVTRSAFERFVSIGVLAKIFLNQTAWYYGTFLAACPVTLAGWHTYISGSPWSFHHPDFFLFFLMRYFQTE